MAYAVPPMASRRRGSAARPRWLATVSPAQSVQCQAQPHQHGTVLVRGGRCPSCDSLPTARGKLDRRLNNESKTSALADHRDFASGGHILFVGIEPHSGRPAGAGIPEPNNVAEFQRSFSAAAASTRIVLLVSPT